MKPVTNITIIALLIISSLQSCQSEKFTEKGIPEVKTTGAEIQEDGVTFYGEILSDGGRRISWCGFTWSKEGHPSPEDIEYVLVDHDDGKTQFSVTVNSTIEKDQIYTLRAFIKADEVTSYGNELTFSGKGSKAPELISVTPGSGIIGDTIIIKGKYFSNNLKSCSVFFGNNAATLISSAIDDLTVVVPYCQTPTVKIRVAISGIISANTLDFNILKPIPLAISPLSGTFGDIVTLSGTYLPTDTSFFDVFFNNAKAELTEISETNYKVRVPGENNISPAIITIRFYDNYVYADKFILEQAVIDDVSPAVIQRWEPIIITGKNFNPYPVMNLVEIGGHKTTVSSSTANEITVDLPSGITLGNHQVVVTTIAGSPVIWDGYLEVTTQWVRMADFASTGRVAAAGFSVGGKIYYGTGLEPYLQPMKDFWVYDPATNKWARKADFPLLITYATGLSINGKGYLAMGKHNSYYYNTIREYDSGSDLWNYRSLNPGPASSMDSPGFVINGIAYIPAAGQMYAYDPVTNQWTKKSYPEALGYFGGGAAFSINGKGYFGIGWVEESGGNVNDFYEYDPVTDAWTKKASFPGVLRNNTTSFALPNGKGYAGMGFSDVKGIYFNDMWEYDPVSDTWTRIEDFPGTPRFGARAIVNGSDAYIIGGYGGIYEKDMWRFSPQGE